MADLHRKREIDAHLCTMYGVYNYKGGVGKSTNLINIASTLERMGHRVLVVDADSQCNITTFYRPPPVLLGNEDDNDIVDDESKQIDVVDDDMKVEVNDSIRPVPINVIPYRQQNNAIPYPLQVGQPSVDRLNSNVSNIQLPDISNFYEPRNIYTFLRPVFLGDRPRIIHQVHLDSHTIRVYDDRNIYLIAGSPQLIDFEKTIDQANEQLPYRYGGFRWAVKAAAWRSQCDIVIVDFGPSSGLVNKIFVMSCDCIIPPTFTDFMSISSCDGLLTQVLPRWLEWRTTYFQQHQINLRDDGDDDYFYRFNTKIPRITPFIVTGYNACTTQAQHNIPPSQITLPQRDSAWLLILIDLISNARVSDPVKQLYVHYPTPLPTNLTPHKQAAQMVQPIARHFGQLQLISQVARCAVSDLTRNVLKLYKNDFPSNIKKLGMVKSRYLELCHCYRQFHQWNVNNARYYDKNPEI